MKLVNRSLAILFCVTVPAGLTTASAAFGQPGNAPHVSEAVCVVSGFDSHKISGTLKFVQHGENVHITGEIHGLNPGEHGFHVHEYGDLSDHETGKSAGGHFNPENQPHGRPTDEKRHVGDLGNITANEDGVAKVDITDHVISLNGPHSIIGRAIIIHVDSDKFTQPTGDAGARAAGGVIGIAKAE